MAPQGGIAEVGEANQLSKGEAVIGNVASYKIKVLHALIYIWEEGHLKTSISSTFGSMCVKPC